MESLSDTAEEYPVRDALAASPRTSKREDKKSTKEIPQEGPCEFFERHSLPMALCRVAQMDLKGIDC